MPGGWPAQFAGHRIPPNLRRSYPGGVHDLPPAPRRLTDITGVVALGTAIWFALWVGLLVAHLASERRLDLWFYTALVGWLLGVLGFVIFQWQRRAFRRGSRGAQRGLG